MFSPNDYKKIADYQSELCISIYIPTYRAGNAQEDRIRLKNALQSATQQLEKRDMRKSEIHQLLGQAESLQDNDAFLNQLSDGLAMFIAPNFFEYYTIPVNVNERVSIGTQFMVRPLMSVLHSDSRFFVLALSQNEIRFFEGSEYSITPVKIDDIVPENMAAALNIDENRSSLQFHSSSSSGQSKSPVYHGQGSGQADDYNTEREQFFRVVDEGLLKMLHDESAPMIIATTDEQAAMYRKISNYSNVVEENISGNVENDDPALIHEKAWAILEPHFVQTAAQNRADFDEKLANNEASFAVTDVIPAAINGRVETLFTNKDYELYGIYNESTNSVKIHAERTNDSIDLLELAVRKTQEAGGKVFNVAIEKLPRPTSVVNAIYRYSY